MVGGGSSVAFLHLFCYSGGDGDRAIVVLVVDSSDQDLDLGMTQCKHWIFPISILDGDRLHSFTGVVICKR